MSTSFSASHVAPNALPIPFATSCGAPMNEVPQNIFVAYAQSDILFYQYQKWLASPWNWSMIQPWRRPFWIGNRWPRTKVRYRSMDHSSSCRDLHTYIHLNLTSKKLLKIFLNTSGHIVLISLMLKEDGEKRLIHELLIDRVDEGWSNLIDGDRGKGQT